MKVYKGALSGLTKSPVGTEKFDSLLERDYMYELEADAGVKSWTKEHGIRIPYKFLFLSKIYLPDFLVTYQNGAQELHETKGAGFLHLLTTHLKRAAADQWCREHDMIYRFIENSRGAMFAHNNALDNLYAGRKTENSLNDLMRG